MEGQTDMKFEKVNISKCKDFSTFEGPSQFSTYISNLDKTLNWVHLSLGIYCELVYWYVIDLEICSVVDSYWQREGSTLL